MNKEQPTTIEKNESLWEMHKKWTQESDARLENALRGKEIGMRLKNMLKVFIAAFAVNQVARYGFDLSSTQETIVLLSTCLTASTVGLWEAFKIQLLSKDEALESLSGDGEEYKEDIKKALGEELDAMLASE